MKNLSKKIITLTYTAFVLAILIAPISVFSQSGASGTRNDNQYQLLEPLPNPGQNDLLRKVDTAKGLSSYLNPMIKIFIGLAAVLSMVMIVVGGLEVMTSELPGNKEDGKHRIQSALFGLLIALGAYALLYTINPDLLKSDLKITETTPTTVQPGTQPNIGTSSEGLCTIDTPDGKGRTLRMTRANCSLLRGTITSPGTQTGSTNTSSPLNPSEGLCTIDTPDGEGLTLRMTRADCTGLRGAWTAS